MCVRVCVGLCVEWDAKKAYPITLRGVYTQRGVQRIHIASRTKSRHASYLIPLTPGFNSRMANTLREHRFQIISYSVYVIKRIVFGARNSQCTMCGHAVDNAASNRMRAVRGLLFAEYTSIVGGLVGQVVKRRNNIKNRKMINCSLCRGDA